MNKAAGWDWGYWDDDEGDVETGWVRPEESR